MRVHSLLVLAFGLIIISVVQASKENAKAVSAEAVAEAKSIVEESQNDLKPHRRSKRTIGHIFDMFKKMMDGLFGGGKGGKGKGKGRGRGRGRGRRPGSPPGGYGAPQAPTRPGYGAPAPRPPPPPRNPGLSGGYAGGNAPPRRPQQAPNNYGGPVQQAPSNYGGPVQQAPSNYGGPAQTQNQDSYGSPQADPVGNQDSYGSPAAPAIGNQDSYGSPVSAPVGPTQSQYGGGSSGQRTPSSDFGPSSVFYEIPAPNLATEAPQGGRGAGAQDSYGSPQAAPISQNQDSYGSPQAAPVGAPDSYGSPQAAPQGTRQNSDSYGSPQAAPQAAPNSYSAAGNNPFTNSAPSAPNDYSSPQAAPVGNNYGAAAPAPVSNNPFIRQPSYGNSAAPLPVTNNDLSGSFVSQNQNSYGSPEAAPVSNNYGAAPVSNNYGAAPAPAPSPVTDLNLPDQPEIIIEGRGQNNNIDSYGGPALAPVGTSAPVPEDVIVSEKEAAPVGEIISTQVESEGEESPLFEDLRNVDFTKADESTEPIAVEGDPIEVDLSEGVVDLTNGLDIGPSGPVDLSGYNEPQDTTLSPTYDYESDDYEGALEYNDDEYFGDPDVPPEIPDLTNGVEEFDIRTEGEGDALADSQESYGDAQESVDYDAYDAQESYGNSADDEYYYDDEGEYYYDDYEEDQSAEEVEATTYAPEDGQNFISVPLMIEEVTDEDAAPVILAGTSDQAQPSYGGRSAVQNTVRSSRRAPYTFQNFLSSSQAEPAKRQISDWSQRLTKGRNRVVWRQFNLD